MQEHYIGQGSITFINKYLNNPQRKSTGMCGVVFDSIYVIQWVKWKFKAPSTAEEILTTFSFDNEKEFNEEYDKYKCSLEEMISAWGRNGDNVFPKTTVNK